MTMASATPTIRARETIQRGVEQLLRIVEQQRLGSDSELGKSLGKLQERAASKEITLTILGEFSAGKTTFVNALLGTNLLQTGILPTTAVCTYISYGAVPACEVTLKNGATVVIAAKDISRFSGETDSNLEVETVRLQLPSTLLNQGLVVVDTPGVNVNIDAHEAITARAIAQSNACVYLMDARQPGKKTTIEFLRRIHSEIDKFFFVLNRADILDSDQQQEALEFVTNALTHECGIPNPRVVLLSSAVSREASGSLWTDRFFEFERHLREFMETERELLICAEFARLLNRGIALSEELLQSKSRLVERELAAHYKVTLPDATDIMRALRRELEYQLKAESQVFKIEFASFHNEVCNGLRNNIEQVISSAVGTQSLVKEAPGHISKAFDSRTDQLQLFVLERFERIFTERRTQVVATVTRLFSGVKWLEQQALLSRSTPRLVILAGLIIVPVIEWMSGVSQSALFMSPFLGLSAGGVLYGVFFWAHNRFSSFTLPYIPSLTYCRHVSTIISSGSVYQDAFYHPTIPLRSLVGALFSGTVGLLLADRAARPGRLRDEMRCQLAPVLDDFEASTKKMGLETIESRRDSVFNLLATVIDKSTDRYAQILERLAKPQRAIREMLETRRQSITADVERLRETHRQILSAYRNLGEQLKGLSTPYRSGSSPEPEIINSGIGMEDRGLLIDPSENIKLLDLTAVASQYRPKKGLIFAWAGCLLTSFVLFFATLPALGVFQALAQQFAVANAIKHEDAGLAVGNTTSTAHGPIVPVPTPIPAPDVPVPAPETLAPAPDVPVPAAETSAPAPDVAVPAPETSAPAPVDPLERSLHFSQTESRIAPTQSDINNAPRLAAC
jgi:ribosome biogenesis GTPase A